MAARSSKAARAARQIGENIQTWRKLQGLTADEVADRAGTSRATMSKLEHGDLGVGIGVVLDVLRALGQLTAVVDATDPYETDLGRIRAAEKLPQRVRR
ncbi:MAG TPA: helix-turn-helix transcriptional regulator [Micromonosporaceae bacterium]|jgi:transcriptional regulator with XRE-family HTH domain